MSEKTLIQFNGHINLGDEFHGNDEGHTLDMRTGQPTLVSVETAKQLIIDFGIAFSYVNEDVLAKKAKEYITDITEQKVNDEKDPKKKKAKTPRRTVLRRRGAKKAPRRGKKRG